jgi:hypothetical protein
VDTSDVFEILERNERKLGTFEEFYTRRGDLEHAYGRLEGIEGKPPFDKVYSYLTTFVEPFAKPDLVPSIWNFEKTRWKTEGAITLEQSGKPRIVTTADGYTSVTETIRTILETQANRPSSTKHKQKSDPEI